ncbi:hypothetical protein DFH09DRAFT_1099668 [Mycena vulgaris]|nr:hypothetical protein DFH09DRAFT_1099668 [Mycena vulgaris]
MARWCYILSREGEEESRGSPEPEDVRKPELDWRRPDRKAWTGGKPEWRRSCGNEEADRSGAGAGKTGNGPERRSKYEKDIQRLRHNLGVELKTRIERGDSVHEGKHGTTLIFQMKYWT